MAVFEWDPAWKPRAVPLEIVEATPADRSFDDADTDMAPSGDEPV
jgi:hypothetical protein